MNVSLTLQGYWLVMDALKPEADEKKREEASTFLAKMLMQRAINGHGDKVPLIGGTLNPYDLGIKEEERVIFLQDDEKGDRFLVLTESQDIDWGARPFIHYIATLDWSTYDYVPKVHRLDGSMAEPEVNDEGQRALKVVNTLKGWISDADDVWDDHYEGLLLTLEENGFKVK